MKDFLHVGDAKTVLTSLPSASVHCCVTSPPYYGLRDYKVAGQIGVEKTPSQYIDNLVGVFREVARVLRPDGTLWLNIGDSYGRNKQILGIPWRLAFALQADGWFLRLDIIWSCPNKMPESADDRPSRQHEYIFLLSRNASYYYDAEAVREPAAEPNRVRRDKFGGATGHTVRHSEGSVFTGSETRNKRSVWTVNTQPFAGAHFAVMPEGIVDPCIRAGTSEGGTCGVCGAPRLRLVERVRYATRPGNSTKTARATDAEMGNRDPSRHCTATRTVGWKDGCGCGAAPVRAVVLDPFSGAGTVWLVARKLGRSFVGVELNPESAALSRARIASESPPGLFDDAV